MTQTFVLKKRIFFYDTETSQIRFGNSVDVHNISVPLTDSFQNSVFCVTPRNNTFFKIEVYRVMFVTELRNT